MIKKILPVIFLLLSCSLIAQDKEKEEEGLPPTSWSSMAGSMIYFYTQKFNGVPYTNINTLGVYGFRYNFKNLGKSSALSVGAVPGLGLAFYSGPYGGHTYFSFDLPLTLEIHSGLQATPFVYDSPVGVFAGGGIGINYLDKAFYLSNPKSGFSYGPVATAGIKLNLGRRPIILRGTFLYNLNTEVPNLKGLGLLWAIQ